MLLLLVHVSSMVVSLIAVVHFLSRASKFKAGSVWTFNTMMACTKVAWLLNHDAKLRDLAAAGKLRYGCLDSWLLFRLLGKKYWGTDRSNLNAGGFYDPWTDVCLNISLFSGLFGGTNPQKGSQRIGF